MARRGAKVLGEDREYAKSNVRRDTDHQARRAALRQAGPEAARPHDDDWVDLDRKPRPLRAAAPESPSPRPKRRAALPPDVAAEVAKTAGRRGDKIADRLAQATKAYENDRYREARSILRPLVDAAPGAGPVRELYGLTLYRLGTWRQAIAELRAFHDLTASYDQHPVLADCYRALKRYSKVAEVWEDLRRAGAAADVVAEGRIVAAGALADQDKLAEAIDLLAPAAAIVRRPKPHQLRLWYALADLFERAGDGPRARSLFAQVAGHDRDFFDAAQRASGR